MKKNFKVGNLVRVLPDTDPGFPCERTGFELPENLGELWGLLGIVMQITEATPIHPDSKHVWVHLQNGQNNIYYYESELEKVAE
jgi:hypothetical protein